MKKKILFILITLSSFAFAGGNKEMGDSITVGATPVPHAQILNDVVKEILKQKGIRLIVKEFTDYIQPNLALEDGSIDANYFQHIPYLESFTKDRNITDLVSVGKVHLEPLGLYSKKHRTLQEIRDGNVITIPNDPSNEARALILLQKAKIIKLNDVNNLNSTVEDISENSHNIVIKEIDAAQLPRSLDDVDFAVINGNYALEVGLNPLKDALILENAKNSKYSNVLVVKSQNLDNPAVLALIDALNSQKVRKYILKNYKGAVIPAF